VERILCRLDGLVSESLRREEIRDAEARRERQQRVAFALAPPTERPAADLEG
jgi:hypothetical protein